MNNVCTYASKRERRDLMEVFRQLVSGWEVKMAGASIGVVGALISMLAWYSETFGVTTRLLVVFFLAFVIDLGTGLAQAWYTGWHTPFKFHKIYHKAIGYVCVLGFGAASKIIIEDVGQGHWLAVLGGSISCSFFVGYLAMADLVSILKNLEKMGVTIPEPFSRWIRAVYKHMTRTADKCIKELEADDNTKNPD